MTLLTINDIHVTYNEKTPNQIHALQGIDLSLETGEFVSIMGPSGSGKSTLLYVLGALMKPSRGRYRFNDISVDRLSPREMSAFRNKNIGFVLQDYCLLRDRTVLENVCIPALFAKNVSLRQAEERGETLLEELGLKDYANRRVSELSGGQCQRVAVARSLLMEPKLILADEPTGSLDVKNRNRLMRLFARLNRQGTTLVVVTHDPAVAECSKRRLQLQDGSFLS